MMTLDAQIAHLTAFIADPLTSTIITVVAIMSAVCVETRRRVARSQRRTRELRLCADLLDQHRAALEEFLSAPDAPPKLKNALLTFSAATSDRELVYQVVSGMCSGERRSQSEADASRAIFKAVDALRSTNPELVRSFETAVTTAFGAMLFRWGETADMVREFITKAVVDSRRATDLFAHTARAGATRSNASSAEGPFASAMPAAH